MLQNFQLPPILVICTLILFSDGVSTLEVVEGNGAEVGNQGKYFIDLPDDDPSKNDIGEICDPNKSNPCESVDSVCTWIPEDMQYRCTSEKNVTKRDAVPPKKLKNKKGKKNKKSGDGDGHEHPPLRNDDPQHPISYQSGRVMNVNTHELSVVHLNSQHKVKKATAREGEDSSNSEEKTRDLPPYEGVLTWDGKSEDSGQCFLKHVLASALQIIDTLSSKSEWIDNNKDQICNFQKFFHCNKEPPDPDEPSEVNIFNDPDYKYGVCRCYESSMPVVDGVCYIPAGFGAKSSCGEDITAPYPVQPWKDAPLLKPKCTPNSECRESQFWFGKRCSCSHYATYNKFTHTCDGGSRLNIPLATILLTICLNFLNAIAKI